MNKTVYALIAFVAVFFNPVFAITVYNNSAVEKHVTIKPFVQEQELPETVLEPISADAACEWVMAQPYNKLDLTVSWTTIDEQGNIFNPRRTFTLVPADYEKTNEITNEWFILLHQPTEQDELSVKLIGPKLALVLQQQVIAQMTQQQQEPAQQ